MPLRNLVDGQTMVVVLLRRVINKHDHCPTSGDCSQGGSAMDSTGTRHWSSLATMTYVAQIFFVQFRLILSWCLFRSCIKAGHGPFQYSSPLQSHILRGRVPHSLSITDPAAILRSFIYSLLKCSPSPSPLPYSSSL